MASAPSRALSTRKPLRERTRVTRTRMPGSSSTTSARRSPVTGSSQTPKQSQQDHESNQGANYTNNVATEELPSVSGKRCPHRNDVIEPDVDRSRSSHELYELRAVSAVDVGDRPFFALRHAVQIELQLDLLFVHRRGLELVVVIARNRLISFFGHALLRVSQCAKSVPVRDERRRRMQRKGRGRSRRGPAARAASRRWRCLPRHRSDSRRCRN